LVQIPIRPVEFAAFTPASRFAALHQLELIAGGADPLHLHRILVCGWLPVHLSVDPLHHQLSDPRVEISQILQAKFLDIVLNLSY
jgi:hypothetical protein